MKLRDELAEKYEKEIEDAISAYLKIDENREPLRYTDDLDIDFAAGFDACEAQYLPMIEKLESALKATKHDYWFMISIIERTTDDKYLKDVVSDCVYRMKFRQPMFDYALAELEQFKNTMNEGEL